METEAGDVVPGPGAGPAVGPADDAGAPAADPASGRAAGPMPEREVENRLGSATTLTALREPSERVSPRARMMWLLGAAGEGAVVVVVAVVAAAVGFVPWWVVAVVAVPVVAWVVVVPRWRYLVHRWEVTETAVYTQAGWWARERRIAPMSRIQTVDLSESATSRIFGLATVTVTTASAAGPLAIAGLDATLARQLSARLTAQADAVAGDAT